AVAGSELRIKFLELHQGRAERFETLDDAVVEAFDDRDHRDHGRDADDDPDNRQRRSQLVRHQGAGREADVLARSKERIEFRHYSNLSDSMGGSPAARRAGNHPASNPVVEATSRPAITSVGLTSVGNGENAAIALLIPYPSRTPARPPPRETRIDSVRN